MPFRAAQQSFVMPPARLFLMRARMYALPVEAFHQLIDGHARMRVRILGAIAMADAAGEVLDRSETVTLFNDMCLLAPATLIDSAIAWETIDRTTVRARFTNGAQTISATLFFAEDGLLTSFLSDDRSRASSDGKVFTPLRFSTPVRGYTTFDVARLASRGDARWTLRGEEFTYGEFELQSIEYNVSASPAT
jgi:hypothetical protein